MYIVADKEAKEAIRLLCDIALKVGGVENLEGVKAILDSVQLEEDPDES